MSRKILVIAVLAVSLFALGIRMLPVQAAANDVIINELMYNPGSGLQDREFLELYNTTGSTIQLNGWCFTQGIVLCFGPTHSITSHGYLIISPNATVTQTIYSLTPSAVYTGSLSNNGEQVTLQDNTATTVNSVTYGITSPWPTSPNGSGASLELKDPTLDNSLAVNWAASIGGPTPAAQNSQMNLSTPVITDVSEISDIDPAQDVTITAHVTDADSVSLIYKVNFDSDQTITMNDDGASGDGASGDDVYGALIDGQVAATLVRYKVSATNGDGTETSPGTDDFINYFGYTVNDPSVSSNAPVINWYIADADYTDMHTNHVFDDVYVPAVVAYDGKVYDNSQVRIKGDYSRSFPKKGYKFKLPKGYSITIAGGSNRPLTEFHMNSGYTAASVGRAPAAWWAAAQAGMPVPDILPARLQRNGEFEGLYVFAEKYEKQWRQAKGYDDGQLLEEFNEVVTGPSDFIERDLWYSHMMLDRKDTTKRDYVLDENDIPSVLNYLALQAVIQGHDNSLLKNTFEYRANTTGRWSLLPWDLDLIFDNGPLSMISPYDAPEYIGLQTEKFATLAVYDQPDLRAMFYRRLRTMVDKIYGSDELLNKYNQVNSLHAADIALDVAKWPAASGLTRRSIADDQHTILWQKYNLLAGSRNAWALPPAQTAGEKASVAISQVEANTTNANEFITLSNSSSSAVDISGWLIEGINYTIPVGAVIPANGSVYVLRDDIGYRAVHAAVIVVGQYGTDLDTLPQHHLVLKTDTGQTVSSYDY